MKNNTQKPDKKSPPAKPNFEFDSAEGINCYEDITDQTECNTLTDAIYCVSTAPTNH